jgi:hypothetical protein
MPVAAAVVAVIHQQETVAQEVQAVAVLGVMDQQPVPEQ